MNAVMRRTSLCHSLSLSLPGRTLLSSEPVTTETSSAAI